MRLIPIGLGLSLFIAGCSANYVGQRERPAARPATGVLPGAEVRLFPDAAQAILALRPQWLTGRLPDPGTRPAVFINGVPTPGLEVLAGLRTEYVREIRYLPAREADIRFGTGRRGAIVVTTTPGGS